MFKALSERPVIHYADHTMPAPIAPASLILNLLTTEGWKAESFSSRLLGTEPGL